MMVSGGVAWRALAAAAVLLVCGATPAHARDRYVDGGRAACSDAGPGTSTAPWCSLAPAAGAAQPGDDVRVAPGVYRGTFRPVGSGTPERPIRVIADGPGVVLDAAGAANAVKLIGVGAWRFEGIEITGAVNQGVWADSTRDIVLRGVSVRANPGAGVQLKNAGATVIDRSTISDNGSAGVLETAASSGTRITGNEIAGNGRGAAVYNGDGIQLGGTGALVSRNTITGNGGVGLYEHGIYTAAAATSWTIEDNVIAGSGAANVKASGAGTVRNNRLLDGTYGIVLASNPRPVEVVDNIITGRAQHLVFATTGARGRLYRNTIRQTGRATASGEASAIFVNEAVGLEIRDTLACYDAPDNLGVALWINNAAKAGTLIADGNRYCSRDAADRHTAFNGSRVKAPAWVAATGQDANSTFSRPPTFDAESRPLTAPPGAPVGAGPDTAIPAPVATPAPAAPAIAVAPPATPPRTAAPVSTTATSPPPAGARTPRRAKPPATRSRPSVARRAAFTRRCASASRRRAACRAHRAGTGPPSRPRSTSRPRLARSG
jgi:hypothetical protein